MATLQCPCGETLNNRSCPSGNNGYLVSDIAEDQVAEWTDDTLMDISRSVWECHTCGRVAIETSTPHHFKWYSPDDGEPGRLMLPNA